MTYLTTDAPPGEVFATFTTEGIRTFLAGTSDAQSVADVASLASLPAAVPGQLVRVETLGRSFVATPPGTSTPVAMVVIDGAGVQWQSVDATSDARWLEQLPWEVDGAAGNDENSGFPGSPLATISEISRRWGPSPVLGAGIRTIRVLSAPADGLFILEWDRTSEDRWRAWRATHLGRRGQCGDLHVGFCGGRLGYLLRVAFASHPKGEH